MKFNLQDRIPLDKNGTYYSELHACHKNHDAKIFYYFDSNDGKELICWATMKAIPKKLKAMPDDVWQDYIVSLSKVIDTKFECKIIWCNC